MINKSFTIVKYLLLSGLLVLSGLLFIPRKYEVTPFQERAGTQYWDLSTGSRIGYTLISASGPSEPFPVIYLHGGPGGRVTDETIQALSPLAADGYDLYFYDQIGSGHSNRLEDITAYTIDRHIQDLAAIIKKTEADKVTLIGHSWGAILAAVFVADHGDLVEKIVFTGPGPIPPIRSELAQLKPPDSLHLQTPQYSNRQGNDKAQNLRSRLMAKWAYLFGSKLASDKEADDFAAYLFSELNKSAVKDQLATSNAKGGAGFYAHIMTFKNFFEISDPRSNLKNSKIPVLIMRGQYDNQKWGYAQEYLQLFPIHELVIIPNAGHFIDVERPEVYLTEIRDFIN
ncbi:MAG: proline iminopeptidase [Saprospiraceae bacterium]|nr:MAG: proline iminopeptidase [Saprospiraceae bacterium]